MLKTKNQELLEQLLKKETELKNSEKEIDNLKVSIKKQENRFEKQVQRTEEFQNLYNETNVKLRKAMDMATNANKHIKHKLWLHEQDKAEIDRMRKIMRNAGIATAAGSGDG